MPRPASITDDRILSAAHAVFMEKGIRGTTAEVARRAGVAEGSLFNRFKSKEKLFRAAMAWRLGTPPWLDGLTGRVGLGDPRRNLEEIGGQTIDFFEQLLPVAMMVLSNPGRRGQLAFPVAPDGEPAPIQALRVLAGYFAAEMRGGRMRRQDPRVLARAFLGSLWHYVFFESMARTMGAGLAPTPMPRRTFVRGLVRLLWEGAAPPAAPANSRAPSAPTASRARRKVSEHSINRHPTGRRKAT